MNQVITKNNCIFTVRKVDGKLGREFVAEYRNEEEDVAVVHAFHKFDSREFEYPEDMKVIALGVMNRKLAKHREDNNSDNSTNT